MAITTRQQASQLAQDASGKIVESVSVENWRPSRKDVTAGAWVRLDDGQPRTAIYIKNLGTDELILAPDDTNYSNDPAQDTCGLGVSAGGAVEPTFGAKLQIWARVATGGADARVVVVESF